MQLESWNSLVIQIKSRDRRVRCNLSMVECGSFFMEPLGEVLALIVIDALLFIYYGCFFKHSHSVYIQARHINVKEDEKSTSWFYLWTYIYIYIYIKRGFKLYLCKKQFKKLTYITNHITVIWVCSIKDFSFFFLFFF